jgi:hypothetical protein
MAKLISKKEQELTIEIKVKIGGNLLEVENNILPEYNYVDNLITQMKKLSKRKNLSNTIREKLSSALTYFLNNKQMMNYANNVKNKLTIGSGVTEAACKTLVKQRLCCSGRRWKPNGAKVVLSLRGIIQTTGRWLQFWNKIDQYGAQVC